MIKNIAIGNDITVAVPIFFTNYREHWASTELRHHKVTDVNLCNKKLVIV